MKDNFYTSFFGKYFNKKYWGTQEEIQELDSDILEVVENNEFQNSANKIVSESISSMLTGDQSLGLPVAAGRSSVYEQKNFINGISGTVDTQFPFQLLPLLENLAMYNRHVSFAVENIVTLSNTNFEIKFSENVKPSEASKMKEHLKTVMSSWYDFSEGTNSLINDLFTQVSTFGVLSAEPEIKSDLSGIKKVFRVSPSNIRFAWDNEQQEHVPLQISPDGRTRGKYAGYVELNPNTFTYITYRRFNQQPYGIPPFFSVIEDIIIENDMIKNFSNMMKRLGMLGFLSVLVKAPAPLEGETQPEYTSRVHNFLENTIKPQVQDGFSKGISIGLKDSHEFKLEGSNVNAGAAETLMKTVKSLIFSGIKQDGAMLGEASTTTETFGRVILAKMSMQIESYQSIVASFLERLILLELKLAGFKPVNVEVKFEKPLIGDRKREQETEQIKINNVEKKINMGIIDQQTGAEELGYNKPAFDEPVRSTKENKDGSGESSGPSNPTPDKTEESNNVKSLLKSLSKGIMFDYSVPDECSCSINFADDVDYKDDFIEGNIKSYNSKITNRFNNAVSKSMSKVRDALRLMDETTSQTTFVNTLIFNLLRDWEKNYSNKIEGIVSDHVEESYSHYRSDESVFREAKGFSSNKKLESFFDIPDATFNVLDFRAIEYLEGLDSLYLGQFITDDDTIKRIHQFLIDEYLGENSPIGANSTGLDKFTNEFSDTVKLESWKIRRIIETTINKSRNYANVMYINQAGIEKFEIVEVNDDRTCAWCQFMHGKEFAVELSVEKIEKLTTSSNDELNDISPFATSIPIEEIKKLSNGDLQAMGIDTPGYHPHCRGRVVSLIK